MSDLDKFLKVALQAVKSVGPVFIKNFGKPRKIIQKGGNFHNLVTEIDITIEKKLQIYLQKFFPQHAFIGEELGRIGPAQAEYTWIVDPVDGTTNYIQGIPYTCISLALLKGRKPIVGVVYSPTLKNLYWAELNKGSFFNGKRLKVSNTSQLEKSFGGVGWGRNKTQGAKVTQAFIMKARKVRVFASVALTLCEIAAGKYDFFVNSGDISLWDLAAAALVVKEAGGKVTDERNQSLEKFNKFFTVVATNGKIHREILTFVNKSHL